MIKDFTDKFPEKIYLYCSKCDEAKDGEDVEIHTIPTEIASYFGVLRERIIRYWNLDEVDKEQYLGSE